MTPKILPALLGAAALSLTSAAAQEGEEEANDEPLRCLSMNSIRSTKILDDSRILFFNARDEVYLNRLDRECLGLSRSGTFAYKVQSAARHVRLCSTDSITVVETIGRGLNCGLGVFEPLSQDELENLTGRPSPAITLAPVDLPKEEPRAEPAAEPAPPAEPAAESAPPP